MTPKPEATRESYLLTLTLEIQSDTKDQAYKTRRYYAAYLNGELGNRRFDPELEDESLASVFVSHIYVGDVTAKGGQ